MVAGLVPWYTQRVGTLIDSFIIWKTVHGRLRAIQIVYLPR